MVDELVRLGYVVRGADPADGRRRIVTLTPRGVDCLRASAEIFDELLAEWRAARAGCRRRASRRWTGSARSTAARRAAADLVSVQNGGRGG